jgi:hypothetical protein
MAPRLALLRSSRPRHVYVDYYFYVDGRLGCADVNAQLLLVSSTSAALDAISRLFSLCVVRTFQSVVRKLLRLGFLS